MITGEIKMYGGNKAPRGWALCNGQILDIASFSALFAVIGSQYGGDGQETFALPDLRGRVPVGSGQGSNLENYVLGAKGGVEKVVLTTNEMPDHNHEINATSGAGSSQAPAGKIIADAGAFDTEFSSATPDVQMSGNMVSSTGGGQAHENMQPYTVVNYIIGVFGECPQ